MTNIFKIAILATLFTSSHIAFAGSAEQNIRITNQTTQNGETVETLGSQNSTTNLGNTGGTVSAPVIAAPRYNPYTAENGALKLLNCRTSSQLIRTFNSNDAAMWVPFMETKVSKGKTSGELKCATAKCKIDMGPRTTVYTFSRNDGIVVYNSKGELKRTNPEAVKRGCSVFN